VWTTSVVESTRTEFVTATAQTTIAVGGQSQSVSVSVETTTELNTTQTANAFHTIYQDSNRIFIVQRNPESSFFGTSLTPASDVSSTTGTRVTRSHVFGTSEVILADESEITGNSISKALSTSSTQIIYQEISAGASFYSKTENVNAEILPNQTVALNRFSRSIVSKSTSNAYFVGGIAGVNELTTTYSVYLSHYTRTGFDFNDNAEDRAAPRTLSSLFARPASYTEEIIYPFIAYTFSTENQAVSSDTSVSFLRANQGGGNTTAQTLSPAGIRYGEVNIYDAPQFYEPQIVDTFFPYCAVYKPYGVVVENSLFGAVSVSGTTLSGLQTVALSRNDIYDTFRNNKTGAGQPNRMLLSYPDQSNDSYTVKGKSVTHTVTGSISTKTAEMISMVSASTGIIGARYWLGGQPENGATFYQTASPGVYVDQSGQTTSFDGSATVIGPGNDTPIKYWHPILNIGPGFLAPADIVSFTAFPGATYCFPQT
jgi:hypothetical protein